MVPTFSLNDVRELNARDQRVFLRLKILGELLHRLLEHRGFGPLCEEYVLEFWPRLVKHRVDFYTILLDATRFHKNLHLPNPRAPPRSRSRSARFAVVELAWRGDVRC